MRPLIAITLDNLDNTADSGRYEVGRGYAEMVAEAGGLPVMLAHESDVIDEVVHRVDGLVLTGGVDPDTTAFGEPMHPRARRMDPTRQAFELGLLDAVDRQKPDLPVLGVCLGMQLMALRAGGRLDQYLPDTLPTHADHSGNVTHPVTLTANDPLWGTPSPDDLVHSHHQQAVADAGRLRVTARSVDGVIEAIDDPDRRCYFGVQWHPERAAPQHRESPLNLGLFRRLVAAAG
ncbi:MAG: gamma-glutamyl-gamma-aminobutyrate hydrolase family protein [Planctomycetota bacterium]